MSTATATAPTRLNANIAAALDSRLPKVGTTIFTVMSALATEHHAINLGQGFPDFDCNPALLDAVNAAMRAGHNQYPPMAGVPALRQAIADKIATLYGCHYDPASDITVTAGATQGIFTALLAVVHPGDDVVVLEPCYDSYTPNIELIGARVVRVPLTPRTFRPDFAAIAAALTPKTRAIIINSPHNPTSTVWTAAEMAQLAALLAPTNIVLISDEVYEHMVFDGAAHVSAASAPGLVDRAFIVSSFGKTYHVTGWKVGFVAAPAALMAEFRKVHQFNVFTVNTPMQHALANFMQDPTHHTSLSAFYQRKRDRFRAGLAATRLKALPCEGSYFQSVDYVGLGGELGAMSEEAFCRHLTTQVGVAAIPLSAFYADGRQQGIVRLCFAKQDETLDKALLKLKAL
jgi:methionine transaminase